MIAKPVRAIAAGALLFAGLTPLECASFEARATAFRVVPLAVQATGKTGFSLMPPALTGIAFTNVLAKARYTTNQTFLNGSGVALGDVDGDGRTDVYLCSLDRPNALYRKLGGWQFENVTESAGVACASLPATSAALVDIDGDVDLDLIVSSIGAGTWIFYNDGKGRFSSSGAPLNLNRAATSLALADIEGDGDLDLYVANYRMISIRDQPNTRFRVSTASGKPVVVQVNGRPVTEPDLVGRFELDPGGKVIEHGEPDALFLNDGQGRFEPVSFTDGRFLDEDGQALAAPPYDWGLSAMFRDINRDGAPDLYVCNDFNSPDRIWINDGTGRFRAMRRTALRTTPLFSMGLDFADVNRDGFDDLYVVDMVSRDHRKRHNQLPDVLPPMPIPGAIGNRPQYSRNTLFLNRGDATFAEIGKFSGLEASEWSWSTVFLDVDLDGFEDVLVVTGNERDSMNADVSRTLNAEIARQKLSSSAMLELKNRFARLELPNMAFRNRGNLTFEEMGAEWGFDTVGVSQGIALGDLDNDGDLDVVINNLNGAASFYRNNSTAPRLAVRLKGLPPNTRGTGARITVRGAAVIQSQEMIAAGRYLSSDDPMRTFATVGSAGPFTIEVAWRSGRTSIVENAQPNQLFEIDERAAAPCSQPAVDQKPPKPAFFEDVSARLKHVHRESAFDDFAHQHLLQRRLSQLGPGVTWFDIDANGTDDLVIGSGAGGRMAVFMNVGHGAFKPMTGPALAQPVTRDQTTVLCWGSGPGGTVLLAGSANYEDALASGSVVREFHLTAASQRIEDRMPGQLSSTGPLAMADLDGTGQLALFVGGRVIGRRYPEPASSRLFVERGGRWEMDAENSRVLRNLGLASGADWSDLDQDGLPELIVACEAGPVQVFKNNRGRLEEATDGLGLGGLIGLWNGVATGDFDSDGRLDIVATNWGLNNRYQNQGRGQLHLWFGDFLGTGRIEVIEAYPNAELERVVPFPGFDAVARALPFVRERIRGHEAYGNASVDEILGERANSARVLKVNTLASMVFMNRGGRFEPKPLPLEAQLAPAFGVSVGDLDGDGHEDLFLSQNFFALQPEIPRMDAGRGLWLRGDGRGGFQAVPGQESGIEAYGEQRGCALADFDRDGRVDLAVAQNAAPTKLYGNRGAKPGLRVRLDAGKGNPFGIGAVLRVGTSGKFGPAREVRAGSGYWSQDSPVQVLAIPDEGAQLLVRWPGGGTTVSAVPKGAREIAVDREGKVRVTRQP